MHKIAIYPGTFDPMTNGHIDLIRRAAKLFDLLIVAIAVNKRKVPWLDLDDRLALATEVLNEYSSVKVLPCSGLIVDFAREHHASVIVRGLRMAADYDDEFILSGMNFCLAPEIESIFLPANQQHSAISSTIVREIATLGGDISSFVPDLVVQGLKNLKKLK